LDTLEDRLHREERELHQDEADLSQRRLEELGTHAENVLSMFTKRRRRMSTSLSKRRMTEKAKARVEESEDAIEDFEQQITELKAEKAEAIEEIKGKWSEISDNMELISIYPYKKDILVDLFGVAWMPYHLVESEDKTYELPGFGPS
jgi:chromosome segregation ATPase